MLVRNKVQLEHGPGQEEPWWDRHGSVQRQIDKCLLQGAGWDEGGWGSRKGW